MDVRAASDFGALVAERREGLCLSQAELARRAGVTREWVVRLENGSTTVTLFRPMRVLREKPVFTRAKQNPRDVEATRGFLGPL